MALRIRLQRHGASHAPVYRMVVTESSHRRDGRHAEVIGNYNPKARGQASELNLKLDRVDYWLSVGAQPSDTARTLINRFRRQGGEAVAVAPAPQQAVAAAAPKPEAPKAEEAPAKEEPKAEAPAAEEAPAKEAAAETPAEEEKPQA